MWVGRRGGVLGLMDGGVWKRKKVWLITGVSDGGGECGISTDGRVSVGMVEESCRGWVRCTCDVGV